ncbi:MAG: rRNA pseudouridine synthase [Planctomycetota bacterium]|jgi:23S rRNA pseudouridine2605 synthase|nr:rRNA pseudouridine synthase [Planctomycetota bacterium]
MEERLHKYLARCGIDSRRKCEGLIARGLVEVNGEVARELGIKIDPEKDRVRVEGKKPRPEKPAYYLHYKVKGVTTTVSDDLGRKTVMDCLPPLPARVYPVGRLDRESEGLLVFTNDGRLARHLTHPSRGVEKTYRAVVEGRIGEEVLRELAEKGLRLGPVLIKPSRATLVRHNQDSSVVLVSVSEGVNREVRRLFAALGHEVKRLLRTRVGPLELEGLKRGATRPLTPGEVARLEKDMADRDAGRPVSGTRISPARGRPGERRKRPGKPPPASGAAGGEGKAVLDDWEKVSRPRKFGRPGPGGPAGRAGGGARSPVPPRHPLGKPSGGRGGRHG